VQKDGRLFPLNSSWQHQNKIGLLKVKSLSDLNKLVYSYLAQEGDMSASLVANVQAVLFHYGYRTSDAEDFSQASRYITLCLNGIALYGKLLNHLVSEVQNTSFVAMKPIIDLYGMNLLRFRSNASRLSMWFSTYTYLRTLVQKGFWSADKQALINRSLLDVGTGTSFDDDTPKGICPWCGGHPEGTCPFEAARIGKKTSRRLAKATRAMPGKFGPNAKKVLKAHKEEQEEDDE